MNSKLSPSSLALTLAVAIGLVLAAACPALAVNGVITKEGSGQQIAGNIRWQPASKNYVITPKGSAVQLTINPSEVADVRVEKPAGLDAAVKQVNQGQYRAAIPVLTTLVTDYQMLQWDVPAAQYLALAHLRNKDAKNAVLMCERVLSSNPDAGLDPQFAAVYWEALLEVDSKAKLRRALDEAVASGPRELAAVAQVRRGDMLSEAGEFKEALVDGYLRTVVFYQSIKSVRPEALYKAAKTFEKLGQNSYAEKMRKRLLAEFPQDEYTQQMKTGA